MLFATELLPWIGAGIALLVLGLLLVVIAPWKRRTEALDPEVEARLLLGEDPDEIDKDLQQELEDAAPVAELHRDE